MNATTETIVTVRKWGNSIGVTIPNEIVEKEKIKPNDRITITVKKARTIAELFGTMKSKKSTQQIKNELKKGWE